MIFDILSFAIGFLLGAVGMFIFVRKDPSLAASLSTSIEADVAKLKADVEKLKAKV
jgi:hypothetical protein